MPGFQAIRSHGTGEVAGKLETFSIPAANSTNVAIGDVVRHNGSSNALTGVPDAVPASGGAAQVLGVVSGFKVTPDDLYTTGRLAGVLQDVFVIVDPNAVFTVDVSATLAANTVGLNADIITTVPTQAGRLLISNMQLDGSTTPDTDVTRPFRIEALLKDDAGVLGNRARVSMNNSSLAAGTLGS